MNEFEVVVAIDTEDGLQFESETTLPSLPPAVKSAVLSGTGSVKCIVKIVATCPDEASDRAKVFVTSVAELLSYAFKAKTLSVEVERCSVQEGGIIRSTVNRSHKADAVVSIAVTQERSEQFLKLLQQPRSGRAEQLLSMYRQARNEHSTGGRYLLMYRLIESAKGQRDQIDRWIKAQRPSVEEVNDRSGKRTIYTHLRNKIHGSLTEPLYPFAEIAKRLDEIEELARMAIAEECESP
jgi:hypothetical protein